MNLSAAISASKRRRICETFRKIANLLQNYRRQADDVAQEFLGNGVTVAYLFLGQPVDFAQVVFQAPPNFVWLFPASSGRLAKLLRGKNA